MRMKYDPVSKRRPTNVSLPADTVSSARELGISISQACEAGLAVAIKRERDRRWQEDNRAAIEANNAWVEQHGLPLDKYRMF